MKRQKSMAERKALQQAVLATGTDQLEIEQVDFEKNAEDQIKKQLDKLATQRPDALAQLLRNWLSED